MITRIFTLKPFPGTWASSPLEIGGSISRQGQTLALHYELRGGIEVVALPEPAAHPQRRWCLWEETCLEFFLGPQNSPRYWEFNLSPAGHWNVFALEDYRQGIQEEPALASLPFAVRRQPGLWQLNLEVDLACLMPPQQPLDAAISAVIKDHQGEITYWALAHPGPEPDFHRRDGFTIKL
jgi:hypothetical protein